MIGSSDLREDVRQLVTSPSIVAVIHEAKVLIRDLEHINDDEYPLEACRIRNLLLGYAKYIKLQLEGISLKANPQQATGEITFYRARTLANSLRKLYAFMRFLRASGADQAPPGIQVALSQLTDRYFPNSKKVLPVCLICPEWDYNFACCYLNSHLTSAVPFAELDREGQLGIKEQKEVPAKIWNWWKSTLRGKIKRRSDLVFPAHVGVLSFARLDSHDVFLFPLLAHELGHFIDFSHEPELFRCEELQKVIWEKVEHLKKLLGNQVTDEEADRLGARVFKKAQFCIRELLADLIAVRMLGFSYFIAQTKFLKTVAGWSEPTITDRDYPGLVFRLGVVFEHLFELNYAENIRPFLERSKSGPHSEMATWLLTLMIEWQNHLSIAARVGPSSEMETELNVGNSNDSMVADLAEKVVRGCLEELTLVVKRVIPDENCSRLKDTFFERIHRLTKDLPPSCPNEGPDSFAEIMSAAWAYQLRYGDLLKSNNPYSELGFDEYRKTCNLVFKAIELVPTLFNISATRKSISVAGAKLMHDNISKTDTIHKGVLVGADILTRAKYLNIEDPLRLDVTPFEEKAIRGASLDVHLGNWFIVPKRLRVKAVQIGNEIDESLFATFGRYETFVPNEKSFLIHPGDLVLGATLEFFALPKDIMAFVEGRSSLGRMGLIVATATQVAPGFHGVVVLELVNAGAIPLEVKPTMPIAQLVFQVMSRPVSNRYMYHGKYYCQIKP